MVRHGFLGAALLHEGLHARRVVDREDHGGVREAAPGGDHLDVARELLEKRTIEIVLKELQSEKT